MLFFIVAVGFLEFALLLRYFFGNRLLAKSCFFSAMVLTCLCYCRHLTDVVSAVGADDLASLVVDVTCTIPIASIQ